MAVPAFKPLIFLLVVYIVNPFMVMMSQDGTAGIQKSCSVVSSPEEAALVVYQIGQPLANSSSSCVAKLYQIDTDSLTIKTCNIPELKFDYHDKEPEE